MGINRGVIAELGETFWMDEACGRRSAGWQVLRCLFSHRLRMEGNRGLRSKGVGCTVGRDVQRERGLIFVHNSRKSMGSGVWDGNLSDLMREVIQAKSKNSGRKIMVRRYPRVKWVTNMTRRNRLDRRNDRSWSLSYLCWQPAQRSAIDWVVGSIVESFGQHRGDCGKQHSQEVEQRSRLDQEIRSEEVRASNGCGR